MVPVDGLFKRSEQTVPPSWTNVNNTQTARFHRSIMYDGSYPVIFVNHPSRREKTGAICGELRDCVSAWSKGPMGRRGTESGGKLTGQRTASYGFRDPHPSASIAFICR